MTGLWRWTRICIQVSEVLLGAWPCPRSPGNEKGQLFSRSRGSDIRRSQAMWPQPRFLRDSEERGARSHDAGAGGLHRRPCRVRDGSALGAEPDSLPSAEMPCKPQDQPELPEAAAGGSAQAVTAEPVSLRTRGTWRNFQNAVSISSRSEAERPERNRGRHLSGSGRAWGQDGRDTA